jgi:hypothetical protein
VSLLGVRFSQIVQIFAPADLINVSCANLLKFAAVFSRFCINAQFYEFETQM